MSLVSNEVWQFVVEWYDPMPQLKKNYLLKYFVEKHMVEMVDLKSHKVFLKKSPCPPEVSASDLFIGSKILIYSRELDIVDYGDSTTRELLGTQLQPSFAILMPKSAQYWGRFIDKISSVLLVKSVRSVYLTDDAAEDICEVLDLNHRKRQDLVQGGCLLVSVHGDDAVRVLAARCAETCDEVGCGDTESFALCANSGAAYSSLKDICTKGTNATNDTATLDSCTCCIIKPHAVKAGLTGQILDSILSQGYEVSSVQTLMFDRTASEEFLEVYKGVIPHFDDHVVQLASGPSVALEIRAEDAVNTFRVTCGPWDISMAKELRPGTLRALFGIDNVRSAVHCTDLAVDGPTESEYCFKIMDKVYS